MKRFLVTICALAALTGPALAQSSTAPGQMPGTPSQSGTPSAQPGPTNTQSTQPGVQRVDGASLVTTYYTANPADYRASQLIGRTVYNLNNENIGEVNDLIIDNGKTIKAVVVSVGGFLGMGERNVAIAPASIVISEMGDGAARLVVNTNREDLKKAQAFNFSDVDKAGPSTASTAGDAPAKK